MHPHLRRRMRLTSDYEVVRSGPPTYAAVRKLEAELPQQNLSLPFPEGSTGRYVKFSNQLRGRGWNNCFGGVLMNAHLAYASERAYVFQDFYWPPEHYRWPKAQWVDGTPRTPLNAIVSGPVAGGAFATEDPAPRAVSEAWFDVACPRAERRYIRAVDIKSAVAEAPGAEVFAHWRALLHDAPERCIEIFVSKGDPSPQTFDLRLWNTPRLLSLWDTFSQSPISRLLSASPIVHAAVEGNAGLLLPGGPPAGNLAPRDTFRGMLAMHLRRGDYEGHCRWMAFRNTAFYGWNLFPHLHDRFEFGTGVPAKRFIARCWPDVATVVKKAAEARRDYLDHVAALDEGTRGNATLDVMYLLTNDKSKWIDEQTDVSMAVDMEIGRRAEVFVGNGWSSLTSNIVYQRLLDMRDPITIRFM
ncbi:hypothetical protein B0H11DRAFT_2221263 [Mycena galericulata]|nr:hypothetical protein B0H11DRAFT_2221263 [Mycena galericulata]